MTNWGRLLIATGGSLKPSKCFYHLISFSWKPDGTWGYDANEEDEGLQLDIPLPDGSSATIEHCGVDQAHKTLGTMTCPSGKSDAMIAHMKERAQGWIGQAISAKLPRRNVWLLAARQFWPKVGFGLGVCSARYMELAECLMKQYYELGPLGGVRRSANRMARQLDIGFFGVGCPHPAVECMVSQLNHLLRHYGCETAVGRLLQVSMELLLIELGMGSQPFLVNFKQCGHLVTDSWLKSVWEKVYLFGITIEEYKVDLSPLRMGDEWLMLVFQRMGYDATDMLRLNRVRLHQQVLFVSDIMDARGSALDWKYWMRQEQDERWSRFAFPTQAPPSKDFRFWQQALLRIRYSRHQTLGPFLRDSHKVWEWRHDEETDRVLRYHSAGMDIYTPSEVPRYANRPNCWTRSRLDQPPVAGKLCSMASVATAV